MVGRRKLDTPVERVIIMDTKSEACEGVESCKKFVKSRQIATYNTWVSDIYISDIRENFLIAPDGSVYEGRGFRHEGQHSFDTAVTSYNNQAIGVSFIGNYSTCNLTSKQEESFDKFIEKYIGENKIVSNYSVYYVDQFKYQSTEEAINDKLYNKVKYFENWRERK